MTHLNYQHIIWDWNGTLLDDVRLCVEVINGVLRKRHLPALTADRYRQIFDFPVINYYRQLGFNFGVEPFTTLSTEFITTYEHRRSECRLHHGAVAILNRIRKQGLTQSILSAARQDYLEEALIDLKIRDLFTAVSGLDNHHADGKTAVGHRHLAELAIKPDHILLVGDTLHDAEVALALGIDCCLVAAGHQSYERLAAGRTKVIKNLAALPGVIRLLP